MTRRTRTAWLVVDAQGRGCEAGASAQQGASIARHWAEVVPTCAPYVVIPVTYGWPPAKKRRSKC